MGRGVDPLLVRGSNGVFDSAMHVQNSRLLIDVLCLFVYVAGKRKERRSSSIMNISRILPIGYFVINYSSHVVFVLIDGQSKRRMPLCCCT